MLKVVLLGPYPVDVQYTCGGVEKVTHNLVEGYRGREDIELHVVSLSHVDRDFDRQDGNLHFHFLKRQRRFCLPTFSWGSVRKARRAIRRLAPDLVHCQEAGLESFIASALPYPTVVTVHAIFPNEGKFYPGLKSRLRYAQIDFMGRRAVRGIDRYIPISVYAVNELQHVAGKLNEVIENPIEQRFFEVPDGTVPGRLLFSGTIYPRKGIHILIEAANQLQQRGIPFQLHLTGVPNDRQYFDQLEASVQEYGLSDQISFLGFVSEEDLAREFGEAAIVVLPSFAETSPMTIQQAMAAGKTVVASRVGGIPYLIEDGISGRLVEAGDVDSLADALAGLLTDDQVRRQMCARAEQEAVSRFSAREVAAKTIAVYHEVLQEEAPA